MARHEERDYRICVQIFDLLAGKRRALEASRVASVVANSRVEVGACCHGFCHRLASYTERS